jgi:predicted metal-dependent peptidase
MATQVKHPKISKAKARLLMDHPFFATLLLRTPVTVSDEVQLAATNGENIFFNPEFLEACSVEDTMVVLAHEVGHDSLLHSHRMGERNHDLWNQACDHAINLMLVDQGFSCPKSVPGGWLADPQYKGLSADRIYDQLRREQTSKPKPQPGDGDGQGRPGGGQNAQGGKPGKGQPGRDWLHGDIMPVPAKTPAAAAKAEQRTKQRVAAAATAARLAGKLNGELARMVDELLEPQVPWTDLLRQYMLAVVKSRDSWTRRNRRFKHIYLPTRHEKKMGPIIFIPDTSGSMWGDDMEKICSEMSHCAQQTKPENIRVIWADTRVAGEEVYEPAEFSFDKLEPKGGGGTDMRVPLEYAEQYDPQVVVLMTDGYTPWPEAPPPYPVIVICTTEAPVPIGEVVRI